MKKKIRSYADFDIQSFLEDHNIDYKEEGKNIGRNWWGIDECPWCSATGYHLGVNLKTKKLSCFVCGDSARIPRFISDVLHCEWERTKELVALYSNGEIYVDDRSSSEQVTWPTGVIDINNRGLKYLTSRNFGQEHIEDYRLKQTNHRSFLNFDFGDGDVFHSDFRHRILAPIIMRRRIVGYTGRDITDQQDPKYQHALLEATIIPVGSCIYNYDTLPEGGVGIFVEGITDVWRLGKQVAGMMGVKHTFKQLRYIAEKKLKKGIILFDEGADDKAEKLCHDLIGIIPIIKKARLTRGGDPGDLNPFDAFKIKQQLLRA